MEDRMDTQISDSVSKLIGSAHIGVDHGEEPAEETAEEKNKENARQLALHKKVHDEVRAAVRAYLEGKDDKGVQLGPMLELSRHLSEKNITTTASTERAIFFSDFVGSCALFRDLGDVAAHELIQEYFEISQVCIKKFSGEIIKYTGDGILALFPNTAESLKSALYSRSMFEGHNEKFPLLPINVRMAVNVGEVIQDEIDAYGTSINLSARLCDASQPGEILCSNIVHLRNQDLGFKFEPHSEVFAKGFPVAIKTHFLQERRADARQTAVG